MLGRGAGVGAAGTGAGAETDDPKLTEESSGGDDFCWDETPLSNIRTLATNSSAK